MITDIEDFFTKGCGRCARFDTADCSARHWIEGLNALRAVCRASGLQESVRWAHPCYRHADRNIAVIGALRGDFRLSFSNASLLKDPQGMLERQGPNTQTPDCVRFTDADQVARLAPIITAYLQEAMGYAEAGIKPVRAAAEFTMQDELVEALDADPELAEAFHALTPGRQRSYVINLNGAKASATRINRIERFRGRILAGKGANERY